MRRVIVGLALCASPLFAAIGVAVGRQPTATHLFKTMFAIRRPLEVSSAGMPSGESMGRGRRLPFWVSEDEREGSSAWYILNARLRMEFTRSVNGLAVSEVRVLTDGKMVAAVDIFRGDLGGQKAVWWSSGEAFTGPGAGVDLANSLTLRFKNYLEIKGIRPGRNVLSFQLVNLTKMAAVREATLLPGSEIATTTVAPPGLRIMTAERMFEAQPRAVLPLGYRVQSIGWPARDAWLVVATSSPKVLVYGVPTRPLGWGLSVQGRVLVEALAPGRYEVTLRVEGVTGGIASQTVRVDISGPKRFAR